MSAVMHDDDSRTIEELIAAQKPGYSLDQRFYTDPEVYELELERIVSRNWIFAGHESELAEPGDFKVLNVAGESAIIVRSEDGDIKAFANVCRHRGSLVCLERRGNSRRFACPYHGWTYDTDGKLVAASEEERFRRVKHDSGFPTLAIEFCLKMGRVTMDDVDFVVETLDKGIRRVADGIASAHGCQADVEIDAGYPVTSNDEVRSLATRSASSPMYRPSTTSSGSVIRSSISGRRSASSASGCAAMPVTQRPS